jgi:hypothetical protein
LCSSSLLLVCYGSSSQLHLLALRLCLGSLYILLQLLPKHTVLYFICWVVQDNSQQGKCAGVTGGACFHS